MKNLNAVTVGINTVHQDPDNARLHSQKQLEYIAASLERFGQQKPIVINKDNIIIAGNGTHLAARDILGWKTISVVTTDLSPEEARAFGIADNQLATQSEWDLDVLSKHIQDMAEWNPMQDWKAIGFERDDIEPVIEAEEEDASNALQDYLTNENQVQEKPESGKPIKVTYEQRELIDEAISLIRMQEQDYKMSEGRCLELLCADFIAGVSDEVKSDTADDVELPPF